MLGKDWGERRKRYDFLVVGSGYGGAILAARISAAIKDSSKTLCLLERGKEWPVGTFPDTLSEVSAAARHSLINPLGLYDFLAFSDISVIQGSGLGGTSLINANVAIIPDEEVFRQSAWPRSINLESLLPYYERAARVLAARPHPKAADLLKVKALDRRARQIASEAFGLNITVNFALDGKNPCGAEQKPCIDCGDCVTGCNVGAKNTLYMNYLPLAGNNGAHIFTQAQVDWLEKLPDGGWRVHGRRFGFLNFPEKFSLEAGRVILSGGSLGTTKVLLRSEAHGLSLSPRLGSGFTGNGDFFGLSYNSDFQTNVLGFGNDPQNPWRRNAPGPTIVGGIRYRANLPMEKRITVEDLSFPKAFVSAVQVAFGVIGGADTDAGDEQNEEARRLRDNPLGPYQEHNALNHTMLYLVMGHDDAKGTLFLKKDLLDPNGRIEIDWDDVGRQPVFTRINEELRRHARALGAHFIPNPLWNFMGLKTLITAHPLGGCPMGEDYHQGAVDEFGRVFSGDGGVHEGLFVADGSLIPTSLGVNPFLTISALSERIAERLVRNLQGESYPIPKAPVSVPAFDPAEALRAKEPELERVFSRVETLGMKTMVNTGQTLFDLKKGLIRNDTSWKGFFPRGHILNQLSAALFTGFKKKFTPTDQGILGVTSDYDERINVSNTLEEVTIKERTGTLEPGKYILLRYTDPPWSAFYDIFKVIQDDLLIGRVYLGTFPRGRRLFTFPMVRVYGLDNMTVEDYRKLYQRGTVPTPEQISGLWEMRAVSNARNTGVVAYLKFDPKPDGKIEARYRFLGLIEGMSEPVFTPDHFQLDDFTPFRDEIRFLEKDILVGKYTTASPPGLMDLFGPNSLGLFHQDTGPGAKPHFSFYYWLRRSPENQLPAAVFLQPLLDIRLPDGLGMTFEEEMAGFYFPGFSLPPGRSGDVMIEAQVPPSGPSPGAVDCRFQVRMTIHDLNGFIDDSEHEARLEGTIHFGDFVGKGPAAFLLDPQKSYFNYLRVNPVTQEAEMVYRLYFRDGKNREYLLNGLKYMQKDQGGGLRGMKKIIHDYTTLYCRLSEVASGKEMGGALLKFKTFESPEAAGSFANFLKSFRVTGTDNPVLKAEGVARFLAFTNQFILREYDPLNPQGMFSSE